MTVADPQVDPSDGLSVAARVHLHPEVRAQRIGELTYLLAPDGTTCVALPDAELAAVAAGDPATLSNLRHAGFTPDSAPLETKRVALTRDGLEFAGFDRVVNALVWLLRRGPRLPLGPLVVVISIAATAWSLQLPTSGAAESVLVSAALLLVLEQVLVVIHELGHAVVLHWRGERVGRVGFGLHWGMPCFYVDATAALMLPRRARAWQTSAGVLSEGLAVAALLGVAAATGSDLIQVIAGQAAVLVLASVLVNLVPALDLDGAWLLADLLDRPQLIHGDPESRWIRAYRYVNGGVGIVFLAASVLLWASLWIDLFPPLWEAGPLGIGLIVVVVLPMAASCVVSALVVLTDNRSS